MSNTQAQEELTRGHSLPATDVTFKAYKFESLHEYIMEEAVRWAEYDGPSHYGDLKNQEAATYISALSLIIVGIVPNDVRREILSEYRAMIYGRRPGEVRHEQDQR